MCRTEIYGVQLSFSCHVHRLYSQKAFIREEKFGPLHSKPFFF